MPDYSFNVFRRISIGGSDGLEAAGEITVRDDDGFRDEIFDDIEQQVPSETNGDQEVVASTVTELDVTDTIRTRGIFRFTNNVTGETYDVYEIFSETAGNPIEQLFIFVSPAPDWLFDGTSRSFALNNSDGTLLYSSVVCFGAGTMITCADGQESPVESLQVGDHVLVRDGQTRPVRWIGRCKVTSQALAVNPKLYPVRISAGALGDGMPTRDLMVSPQHRVLIRSVIAKRIFSEGEVLIPAIKLTKMDGIAVAYDVTEVEYFHVLLDAHEVIFSNGAPTESLFLGAEAMKSVSPEARAEIQSLFPQVLDPGFRPNHACLVAQKGRQIDTLLMRHRKNRKPLLSEGTPRGRAPTASTSGPNLHS